MADNVVRVIFSANTIGFNRGISTAKAKLSGFQRTVGRVSRTMVSFFALFAARAALKGFASMVKTAGDLSMQMAHVQRVTRMSADEIDNLKDSLLKLSTTIVAGVDELAALTLVSARAGIRGKKDMLEVATVAAMMGNVMDLTAEQAAAALIKIGKATDIPVDKYRNLASTVLFTSKKFAASSSEIITAMLRILPAAGTLDIAASELAVLGAMAVEAGNRASRAGTTWNRAFLQMAKNSKKAAVAIGMDIEQFKNAIEESAVATMINLMKVASQLDTKIERSTMIMKIFNLVGMRAVGPLAKRWKEMELAIEGANKAFENGVEITEDYAIILKEFNSQAKLTKDTWTALKNEVGEQAIPTLTKAHKEWASEIANLNERIKEHGILIGTASKFLQDYTVAGWAAKDVASALDKALFTPQQSLLSDAPPIGGPMPGIGPDTILGRSEKAVTEPPSTEALDLELEAYRNFLNEKTLADTERFELLGDLLAEHTDFKSERLQKEQLDALNSEKIILDNKINSIGKQKAAEEGLLKLRTKINLASQKIILKTVQVNLQAMQTGLGGLSAALNAAAAENKKFAAAAKMVALGMAIIGTAVAVINGLQTPPFFPVGIAMAAMAAAAGAIQIGTIMAQGFQKGGLVPGAGSGDIVPAMLEPGELVIPKDAVSSVINNNSSPNIVINMEGALLLDDPNAIQTLYREGLRDIIRDDIRIGRDEFYGV